MLIFSPLVFILFNIDVIFVARACMFYIYFSSTYPVLIGSVYCVTVTAIDSFIFKNLTIPARNGGYEEK